MIQMVLGWWDALINFHETNAYIDLVILMLVIFSGYFAKQYLVDLKMNMAFKTLMVATLVTILYMCILKFGEKSLEPTYWKKCFITYFTATSMYEVILKHIPLFWKVIKEKLGIARTRKA